MKIINPIYDKAFKYLMQNDKFAKKVLSVLLDQEVLDVKLSQQETVVADEKRGFTLFRLDFKAVILDIEGKKQTVLIELQKSKYATDMARFRAYLGSNYLKIETETDAYGNLRETIYPIITIYILGYNVSDIPYLAVRVDHKITDASTKQPIELSSDFINQLNHRSHIIQVRRLPEHRYNRLEIFMELFNQAYVTDKKYILEISNPPAEFEDIVKYLQTPVMNDDFRRQLETEEELDVIFDKQEAKYLRQLEEAKQREEEAKQREEEALKREQELALKLAKQMKKFGISADEIAKETGLSVQIINTL